MKAAPFRPAQIEIYESSPRPATLRPPLLHRREPQRNLRRRTGAPEYFKGA